MSELLKRTDVQRLLGLSESTVIRLERAGKLPTIKFGRCVRYRKSDVERIIADAGQ